MFQLGFNFLFILSGCLLFSFQSENFHIKIEMQNIRNSNGHIQLQLYKDETNFKKETPYKILYISKNNVHDGKLTYNMTLPKGTWGFAMLDDENKDGKMNYSFILPKEGFAFSNFYLSGWSKPKFNEFAMNVASDRVVYMKFRYVK